MIMTEAQRPQVGEYHYRRAGALLARRAKPDPDRQSRLEPEEPGPDGGVAPTLPSIRSNSTRPSSRPCSAGRRWRRPTAISSARGELLDAAETLAPGAPSVMLQRAILHGRVERLRQGARRARRNRAGAQAAALGPLEWSAEGRLARPDGPPRRGLRRIRRRKAHVARNHRPELSRGRGGGARARG